MSTTPNRYALFLDIAGPVTKDIHRKEFLTVGGLAFLPETLGTVRAAIPKHLPKWRDSRLENSLAAAALISATALVAITYRTRREPAAWRRFWNDAGKYARTIAQVDGRPAGFVKAANVIKCWLFGECAARLMGEIVRRLGLPTVMDAAGLSALAVDIVCDTDIQGAENVSVFKGLWDTGGRRPSRLAEIGLARYTRSVELRTEQQESILLLADHLAGAVHAFSAPAAVDRPPAISQGDLQTIALAYRGLRNMTNVEFTFDILYTDIFGTPPNRGDPMTGGE